MNDQNTNPEIDQDRVFDTVDHFNKFGDILFRQQRSIYKNIGNRLMGKTVIEAGCGNGVGSAVLERWIDEDKLFLSTDKLMKNVAFAKCLYPWMDFELWDINKPWPFSKGAQIVVCIETIEHVANPQRAIENLIDAATEEVWISTPNGAGKKRPPNNRYHVCEYTTFEILDMIPSKYFTEILGWKNLEPLYKDTKVDPLVYRIKL